jgi:hypothetical protein
MYVERSSNGIIPRLTENGIKPPLEQLERLFGGA